MRDAANLGWTLRWAVSAIVLAGLTAPMVLKPQLADSMSSVLVAYEMCINIRSLVRSRKLHCCVAKGRIELVSVSIILCFTWDSGLFDAYAVCRRYPCLFRFAQGRSLSVSIIYVRSKAHCVDLLDRIGLQSITEIVRLPSPAFLGVWDLSTKYWGSGGPDPD